jgi:hypothetical protein
LEAYKRFKGRVASSGCFRLGVRNRMVVRDFCCHALWFAHYNTFLTEKKGEEEIDLEFLSV